MATWDFTGKVVLIAGGTGGLGRSLSKAFVRSGANVYALGLDDENMRLALADEDEEAGEREGTCRFETCDITDVAQLKSRIAEVVEREGRIDVLVNAAGICPLEKLEEISEQSWERVMDINLKGVIFACQAVMGTMVRQKSGVIINVGSIAGYNGGVIPSPAYGASKAAVHALTKWLASNYSSYGVRINTIAPGPFETDMIAMFPDEKLENMKISTPNRRVGRPEEVVHGILFLADDASIHITGASLDVCGGQYLR
jgi:NAD(P)-dependent dehydrogenase (short-subunit alcohol dehydrogenase family)